MEIGERLSIIETGTKKYIGYVLSCLCLMIIFYSCVSELSYAIFSGELAMKKGIIMYCTNSVLLTLVPLVGLVSGSRYHTKEETDRTGKPVVLASAVFLIMELAVCAADVYVWAGLSGGVVYSSLGIHLGRMIVSLLQVKFVRSVARISQRFGFLNKELDSIFECTASNKSNDKSSSYLLSSRLSAVSDRYQELCGEVGELEAASGPQNLFLLVFIFEQLVHLPFFCLSAGDLFGSEVRVGGGFSLLYGVGSLLVLCQLIFLLWPCSLLEDQAKKTRNLISKFLDPLKNPQFSEVEIFSIKVSHGFGGISVLSLFTLNLSLAVDVLGGATTYLVIFIQF